MSVDAANLQLPADPLIAAGPPERVNYATGVLLQAEDFRDEQTYHRGRLATTLSHLFGHGTVAGLRVVPPKKEDNELELKVEPGVAIDRYGRLIEVTEPWCIRLARWFAAQDTGALLDALDRTADPVVIVVDLFLSVADCGRRKTPSFAQGPFDALDALVPARLAEEPSFELVLRPERPTPKPGNDWPEASASAADKREAVLSGYRSRSAAHDDGRLPLLLEHVDGHDRSAVLLARIRIPATSDAATNERPVLDVTHKVAADNGIRPIIFLPGRWLGSQPDPTP